MDKPIGFAYSHNPLRTLLGPDRLGPDRLEADGSVAVPDGPGLGIELRPEHLEPYLERHWSIG